MLEQALRNSPTPLTVSELLDLPDVRAAAIAEYGNDVRVYTDRLSNALGLMWRRKVIVRYPAPEKTNSQARFMYEWSKETLTRPVLPSTFRQQDLLALQWSDITKKGLVYARSKHRAALGKNY